jgi:predicted nucleotide-binding protein
MVTKNMSLVEKPPEVFLVHGRNEGVRESVARFLEGFGIRPIILHEQANEGRTVIEKVIDHSNVPFAVVLLTADDVGRLAADANSRSRPRARQNVLFELGFFIGKLGRRNVCALYQCSVDIPSDYHGVLFIEFDEQGAWRLALARELKAAGMNVDLNRVTGSRLA